MKHAKYLSFTLMLAATCVNALACFTVYDRANRVVYQSDSPPVDMSRPIHETLPALYPHGHLVFDREAACSSFATRAPIVAAGDSAPLLTSRRIAQAMKVPYIVMSGEIVMVPRGKSNIAPGVTVVPAQAAAPPSSPVAGTVITELHNPPMTIVQSGEGATVSELEH